MSWASSNSALIIAVSNAGGMGVLAAGPLRIDDYRRILGEIRAGTKKPYGVNIPLNSPKAREMLDIAHEARIPVMVASQGGPREHLARFRAIDTKWLHVVASVEHARKAEATGVDAMFQEYSLKQAALRGDVEWGKVEAGQSAGLVHDIVPAGALFHRLVAEMEEARRRLASL